MSSKLPGQGPCPDGYILRKGYTDSRGRKYKPTCIKDRGNPGKGPVKIPPPKKGKLSQYGYENVKGLTIKERRKAIDKAMKNHNHTTIVRDLHAIATLNKNTNPRLSKMIRNDAQWASEKYLGTKH